MDKHKQRLIEMFQRVCGVKINEAYIDNEGKLQDMDYNPKFDNMVNAFCNEFIIHFSDSDHDEPILVNIIKSDDNIKVTNISRGIGDEFTSEQYDIK